MRPPRRSPALPDVDPRHALADAGEDLPRDRAGPASQLVGADADSGIWALRAEEHDLVAELGADVGDVDHAHVHGDGADHLAARATDEHLGLAGHAPRI